jgi:outer membrane protein
MSNKTIVGILGMSMLLFAATHSFAAETAVKVCIVDLDRAVNESTPGKKAKIELESVIKGKQEALDEKGKAIEKLKYDIEERGNVMSTEARKNKEGELEQLTREYQRALSDSQNDVRKKESELTGPIVKDLREIINIVAREDRYDLILDNNPAIVIFADKGSDITDKVIKKFDESKGKSANK